MSRLDGRLLLLPLLLALAAPASADDLRALRVADRIHHRLGGEVLDHVALIGFDFVVTDEGEERLRRSHLWDRVSNDYRVELPFEGERCTVWMDLDLPEQGRVRCAGRPVDDPRAVEAAHRAFINDTWWVLMPFKWRDPGVELTWIGPERSGRERWDVVLLTFEDGTGLTSGDRYWAYVGRDGRMVKWEMLLEGSDGPPRPVHWEGWKTIDGVTVSTRKTIPGSEREILIENVELDRRRQPSRLDPPLDAGPIVSTADLPEKPAAPEAPSEVKKPPSPRAEPPSSRAGSTELSPAAAGEADPPASTPTPAPTSRAAPPAPAAGRLLVLDKAGNEALLVDPADLEITARLPTGEGPHEVVVSPDGSRAFVGNYGHSQPGSTITVIDLDAEEVAATWDLAPHGRPHGFVFDGDGRLWVTVEASRAVLALDARTGEILREVKTGQEVSHMIAAAPKTGKLFVANIGSGTVTVIPGGGGEPRHIEVGAGPEGIAVHPVDETVWVANRHADEMVVLHPRSEVVVDRLPTGDFPIRVAFTPDGELALASHVRSGEIWAWDGRTRKRREVFDAGTAPIGILVSPDGKRLYVADSREGLVRVFDPRSGEEIGRFRAGRQPDGMAWAPAQTD